MKKTIMLMAILMTQSLTACPICTAEMEVIEAKLEACREQGLLTDGEISCYKKGLMEGVTIIMNNHPKGMN